MNINVINTYYIGNLIYIKYISTIKYITTASHNIVLYNAAYFYKNVY